VPTSGRERRTWRLLRPDQQLTRLDIWGNGDDAASESAIIEPDELVSFTTPVSRSRRLRTKLLRHEVSELAQLIGAKLVVIDGAGPPLFRALSALTARCMTSLCRMDGGMSGCAT